MSSDDVAIRVENLSKCYQIYDRPQDRLKQSVLSRLGGVIGRVPKRYCREFWALKDISFEVKKGEAVGIIGRNGSGKSTLLQILAGTLAPTTGKVDVDGRTAALLELGSGFNLEFTGKENVFLNGQIMGLTRAEIECLYDRIAEFADIGEFIDQPVKTYSSGMFVRLAFAVQAHIDATVVIIDEALAVGDIFFRQKCYARLEQLRAAGASILLVSHSMADIEQFCERAILLNRGRPMFVGPASEVTKHYYLLDQTGPEKTVSSQPRISMANERAAKDLDRPPGDAFFDLTNCSHIGNGQARCVGVAVCESSGKPTRVFHQGETAVFHYEFEMCGDIEVPICGIVVKNDRGIIVHGKNSWQSGEAAPAGVTLGERIICRQEIVMDLAPGEYVFEVGLSAVSESTWKDREHFSHEDMIERRRRICHVPDIGPVVVCPVIRGGVQVLRHHGLANLPGSIQVSVAR